jgi:DNA-binding response OmpR family regulator
LEGWPVDEGYLAAGGKAKKVLVVSDDDEITQVIARSLRQPGAVLEVFSAGDSHEAECQIISLRPALVVLRWMAPRVNSDGICRWLKLNPAFEHTRVLAIAQEDSLRHLERILEAGADDVTWEPLDSDTVQRKLCALLMSTTDASEASTELPPMRGRY